MYYISPSDDEVKCFSIHYLTPFCGPIVACLAGGIFCLIPMHNILNEPNYWYEYQISSILGVWPFIICGTILQAIYFADFTFKDTLISSMYIGGVGLGTYITCIGIYFFIWTKILEFTLPMAFNLLIAGSLAYLSMFFVMWFR